jgi:hypothetical protein
VELSDLEISARIAEIEGLNSAGGNPHRIHIEVNGNKRTMQWEPLGDCASDMSICFQLMVKHSVVVFHRYENDVLICWAEESDGSGKIGKPMFSPAGSELEAIKRCICLAIIEKEK